MRTLFFGLWFLLPLSLFFPRLISAVADWMSTCLGCRSEMCCTWLAGNTGCKNDAKNRHLGIIAHICRAISSQLRHISTIGIKLLNNNTSPICRHNMVNFGLLAAEICWRVWGNGFRVLAALLHGTVVVGVSQTLRR